jgi:xylose isomerase domain protein TIM barrel
VTRINDDAERRRVADILATSGATVGFGGQPYILKGKLNLNSPDEQERAHAIEVLKGGIDQAYELGAGKFGFLSGPKPPAAQRDQALELLADSIVQLGRYARSKGDLALSLETFDDSTDKKAFIGTNRLACELAYEVRKAIPNFGLMVDLSHLPMQGETSRQALRVTQEFINHAHIGNCVIGDPNHPDYGDLHPYFGHPEGENNVPQVREFLRCLLDIGYLRPDAPERNIVAFEVQPLGGQRSRAVIADAKRVLREAWRTL